MAWPALLALAACGSVDDRPRDAQYITDTILAPTCGRAECHSQFTQAGNSLLGPGIVLDTYDHARRTLLGENDPQGSYVLVQLSSAAYDPIDIEHSPLITWVTQNDPLGEGIGRMPSDAPLPNADVELLKSWIVGPVVNTDEGVACTGSGASCPHLDDRCIENECIRVTYPDPAHGAACDPSLHGGLACNGAYLVECEPDWSFSKPLQFCPLGCTDPLISPVATCQQ